MSVLEKDTDIRFPHVTVLKASAGSGKTYTLTERFIQFLLSGEIPQNHLRNILAITFSNNAAKEMKGRILSWLKDLYFEDPQKIDELSQIVSLKKEHLAAKAGAMIDTILRNYSEFQVKTIDSFMASIYKASAINLGYSPDFDIVMAPQKMMGYAFSRFLRGVREGEPEAQFLEELLEIILESRGGDAAYLWDPSKDFLEETTGLYYQLSGMVREIKILNAEKKIESLKKKIREEAEGLQTLIQTSGLTESKGSSFYKIVEAVRNNHFSDLIDKGLVNGPVVKPKKEEELARYKKIGDQWERLGDTIKAYIELYAMKYYDPYLKAYEVFKNILEEVKKREGTIFIQDINKKLSDYLDQEIIPDVYFRMGETIYHYLIDEFQDTSPIQWANLFPLIENSLAQGGSLFAVGDTKQAIYGFRNADYGIMKGLEIRNPFPSAYHSVKELEINYRSLEGIVDFNKALFKEEIAGQDKYREPATRSGLIDYEQRVKDDHKGSGYVEVIRCDKDGDEPAEKEKIQNLIKELAERGYAYSDIAILAYRNEDVVHITTWLNEMEVPFISYSSLDIRTRKITAEMVALITFLDSPPDDLSFGGFVLGEIFRKALESDGKVWTLEKLHPFFFRNRRNTPLYKAFQKEFPELWETYFEDLFKRTGYLPLYDLANEIYSIFRVFDRFQEEEATLVKILEVIKDVEGEGKNNPGDFLKYALDEDAGDSIWTMDVPSGINAVKVMTIHKAKGLGFPVTLVLVYEETPRGFKYILDERDREGHLLKINQQIMKASPFLQERYEEEKLKDMVNKLNTLYVGFTRAEDELYVISVRGKRNQFPIDLLQRTDFPTGSKGVPRSHSFEPAEENLALFHHSGMIHYPFEASEELNLEERRRGEFIHRVLYLMEDGEEGIEPEIHRIIRQVNEEFQADYSMPEMEEKLLKFLQHEEIKPYFEKRPGRVVKKEQDFTDLRGKLFRMDRVIFEGDRVVVVDYKTGDDKEAEVGYVSQIKNYIRILEEIYPGKQIEGIIAYVDLKKIRNVR